MSKYVCIHGHFYQPPRENPWIDAIETQDSAAPFHDWNERITAECYATNGAARILDGQNRIVEIVNNYARISFNVGPTLLRWMQRAVPDVYQAILAADRESMQRFGGHGSAMAQGFHHAILPLSNQRDKRTEIAWGVADFRARFQRMPEAMWLPEAAVDLETLDLLVDAGLKFTVLSPYQASRVKLAGQLEWQDASAGRIDPTRPYIQRLPSGRTIALFFYDGIVSRAVAFERLLNRGEDLAERLIGAFDAGSAPQLVNIATDGETYGHHHRFGEMALAYALHYIESRGLAKITNYAEFLALYPPTDEVEIREYSSWSCFHGVERWRSDCGCNTGGQPGWNQAWRAPLRLALDWLRDTIAGPFEQLAAAILRDPWAARDDYVHVVLDRSPESIAAFVQRHALPGVTPDPVLVLRLMELQRHALMMYTSCGWFFSELSGIETTQVLQYAARAIQIARDLFGDDLEPAFRERLRHAPSNLPHERDGAQIYERHIRPLVVDLPHVAAHYALTSLFDRYGEARTLYCYRVERRGEQVLSAGQMRLGIGTLQVASQLTLERSEVSYGVLHLGAQTMLGGVRAGAGGPALEHLAREAAVAFQRADIAEIIRLLSAHFGRLDYSLRSLFRDQQREVLRSVIRGTLTEVKEAYHDLYTQNAALMRFMADLHMPLPAEFRLAAAYTLTEALRRAVQVAEPRIEAVVALLEEARQAGVDLDLASVAHTIQERLAVVGRAWREQPDDLQQLQRFGTLVSVARALPTSVDLADAQNLYASVRTTMLAAQRAAAAQGEMRAQRWVEQFTAVGEQLWFRIELD